MFRQKSYSIQQFERHPKIAHIFIDNKSQFTKNTKNEKKGKSLRYIVYLQSIYAKHAQLCYQKQQFSAVFSKI